MSLLITQQSLQESYETIKDSGFYKKLNTLTFKGNVGCKTKKELLDFMVLGVIVNEEIPVTEEDCKCIKKEFSISQPCSNE